MSETKTSYVRLLTSFPDILQIRLQLYSTHREILEWGERTKVLRRSIPIEKYLNAYDN